MNDELLNINQALDRICKNTGMTRRQAKRDLLKKLRANELPVFDRNGNPIDVEWTAHTIEDEDHK